jgi:hypothetical protein
MTGGLVVYVWMIVLILARDLGRLSRGEIRESNENNLGSEFCSAEDAQTARRGPRRWCYPPWPETRPRHAPVKAFGTRSTRAVEHSGGRSFTTLVMNFLVRVVVRCSEASYRGDSLAPGLVHELRSPLPLTDMFGCGWK